MFWVPERLIRERTGGRERRVYRREEKGRGKKNPPLIR